jgi:hypothetical protein
MSLDVQVRRAIRVARIGWGGRIIASSPRTTFLTRELPANVCLG